MNGIKNVPEKRVACGDYYYEHVDKGDLNFNHILGNSIEYLYYPHNNTEKSKYFKNLCSDNELNLFISECLLGGYRKKDIKQFVLKPLSLKHKQTIPNLGKFGKNLVSVYERSVNCESYLDASKMNSLGENCGIVHNPGRKFLLSSKYYVCADEQYKINIIDDLLDKTGKFTDSIYMRKTWISPCLQNLGDIEWSLIFRYLPKKMLIQLLYIKRFHHIAKSQLLKYQHRITNTNIESYPFNLRSVCVRGPHKIQVSRFSNLRHLEIDLGTKSTTFKKDFYCSELSKINALKSLKLSINNRGAHTYSNLEICISDFNVEFLDLHLDNPHVINFGKSRVRRLRIHGVILIFTEPPKFLTDLVTDSCDQIRGIEHLEGISFNRLGTASKYIPELIKLNVKVFEFVTTHLLNRKDLIVKVDVTILTFICFPTAETLHEWITKCPNLKHIRISIYRTCVREPMSHFNKVVEKYPNHRFYPLF